MSGIEGAWLAENGRHPNSLLRHDGVDEKGIPHFTDVSYQVGLAGVDYPTQTASWADYDLDGDLDLFIGNRCKHHSTLSAFPKRWRSLSMLQLSRCLEPPICQGSYLGRLRRRPHPDLYYPTWMVKTACIAIKAMAPSVKSRWLRAPRNLSVPVLGL